MNYKTQIQAFILENEKIQKLLEEISEETPSDREANHAQTAIADLMEANESLKKLIS